MSRLIAAIALACAVALSGSIADAKPLRQKQQLTDTMTPIERMDYYAQGGQESAPVRSSGRNTKRIAQPTGLGVVRSGKTGATANVDPRYRAAFQSYIDDLEAGGASVRFMGGYRGGRCGLANQHACGQAIDVCQHSWGVVDRRCNLPPPSVMAATARRNGLYEGAEWCRPDTGHAQVQFSGACNRNLYADVAKFKRETE